MFKIKNGWLISKEISMAIPEGFNLAISDSYTIYNSVRFISDKKVIKYGVVVIEMSFNKSQSFKLPNMPKTENYGATIRSAPIEVKRGTGVASAAFYSGIPGYTDFYIEKYLLHWPVNKNNEFTLMIYNRAAKGSTITATAEETLELPIVKKFLESIRYK